MMPTVRSNESVDTTPLLTNAVTDPIFRSRRFIRRPPSLRGAARFLGRASSRLMMREPSMRVRKSAAQQIEERQSDWAYSCPIVILDLVWNLAFVLVSIGVLIISRNEIPAVPLRLCCTWFVYVWSISGVIIRGFWLMRVRRWRRGAAAADGRVAGIRIRVWGVMEVRIGSMFHRVVGMRMRLAMLQSMWSLQIQRFLLFGGSLDSIGFLPAAKL